MSKYYSDLSNQFKGRNIIVTGSTQGIVAETEKLFAARGASSITICGRQEEKGIKVKKRNRRFWQQMYLCKSRFK